MSALEPNTQAGGEPTVADFLRGARWFAAIPLVPAVGFVVLGLVDFFRWSTWPRWVELRKQSLGMDWWLHAAVFCWAAAVVCLLVAAVLLLRARRRAERDLQRYRVMMAEVEADAVRSLDEE